MQQLNSLNEITAECDRVVKGMLDGSIGRDDGLFATAALNLRIANEMTQFVTYALPILHAMHQALLAAQAQVQAAQQAAQQAPAAPQQQPQAPAPQTAPPANVVPINAAAQGDVQVVAGAPRP